MIRLPDLKDLLSNDSLWRMAGIAIAIGIVVGGLIVMGILVFRRRQFWHDSSSLEDWVGTTGTVEVAFDELNSGKVRLQLADRTIACLAYSGESHQFKKGDPILVVGIKGEKVWVIPATEF